jgi:hypothetical protein
MRAARNARTGKPALVAAQAPHTKLLNDAAEEILGGLGVVRMGRSRTWVDDRGWWLGVMQSFD